MSTLFYRIGVKLSASHASEDGEGVTLDVRESPPTPRAGDVHGLPRSESGIDVALGPALRGAPPARLLAADAFDARVRDSDSDRREQAVGRDRCLPSLGLTR
jgi:hypothetical protein